jgi:hypothetical protein
VRLSIDFGIADFFATLFLTELGHINRLFYR